jgi:BatD DUF11 like domain
MRRRFPVFLHVLASLWLLLLPAAWAQDVQVTATVDSETVAINENLQLTITITGGSIGDDQYPRVQRLRGFRTMGSPSISTQFQWINGRSSSSKSFVYTLIPEREGPATIDPIEVPVGHKTYRTQPISIRVTAASARAAPPRRRSFNPFGDDDFRGNPRAARLGDEVFVTAELDRSSAYPGQQVTLSYHLYTMVGVSGIQLQENPPLTGFWVEDLAVDPSPNGTRRVINGREYVDYMIKKHALFPNAGGVLKISPATFAVSVKRGDFFGLFGQAETVYRKTSEVSLEVKPFPANGRPADFTNGVGSFTLASSLDKREAAVGDAVALKVKLSGRGNLKMIPDLPLPLMPDFAIYSSKRSDNVRAIEGDLIGGDESWEYVVVPKAPGQQTVPSLTFSYFDPQREAYETVTTPPLELRVIRPSSDGSPLTGLSGVSKQNLARQGTDINFIKLSANDLEIRSEPIYRTFWFYLAAGIPLLFNIGAFLYSRERARESENLPLARSRKARRTSLARLKRAEKIAAQEPRRFYDEAAAALSGYLTDKFNLPEIAVTGDSLERSLKEGRVSPETVRETMVCLQECDFGRFVSPSSSTQKMRELAGRIRKIIYSLEQA